MPCLRGRVADGRCHHQGPSPPHPPTRRQSASRAGYSTFPAPPTLLRVPPPTRLHHRVEPPRVCACQMTLVQLKHVGDQQRDMERGLGRSSSGLVRSTGRFREDRRSHSDSKLHRSTTDSDPRSDPHSGSGSGSGSGSATAATVDAQAMSLRRSHTAATFQETRASARGQHVVTTITATSGGGGGGGAADTAQEVVVSALQQQVRALNDTLASLRAQRSEVRAHCPCVAPSVGGLGGSQRCVLAGRR